MHIEWNVKHSEEISYSWVMTSLGIWIDSYSCEMCLSNITEPTTLFLKA